jgi:proteasome lid subunit RPN8/RPN11
MRAEASDSAPEECCGLLLGRDAIEEARPAANLAAGSPAAASRSTRRR